MKTRRRPCPYPQLLADAHGGLAVRRLTLLALVLLSNLACGATMTRATAPDWARVDAALLAPGTYVGEGLSGKDRQEALVQAAGHALAEFAGTIGTEVRSEMESREVSDEGRDTSSLRLHVVTRGVPITVRGTRVTRRRVVRDGDAYRAWVEVIVPEAERLRLQRMALGKTWFVLACTLDGVTGCPMGVAEGLRTALSQAGLTLADPPDAAAAGLPEARAAGVAYVLRATVSAEPLGSAGEEWYARASAALVWQDTTDEQDLVSAGVGPLKGGHYGREAALAESARQAATALVARIRRREVVFAPAHAE